MKRDAPHITSLHNSALQVLPEMYAEHPGHAIMSGVPMMVSPGGMTMHVPVPVPVPVPVMVPQQHGLPMYGIAPHMSHMPGAAVAMDHTFSGFGGSFSMGGESGNNFKQ